MQNGDQNRYPSRVARPSLKKKEKKRKGPEERARHRGREIPVDANAGYAREAAKSNHAKTREWSSFLYARAARHTPDK